MNEEPDKPGGVRAAPNRAMVGKHRMPAHDYTQERIYMVTIATEGRVPLFGHVEGDAAIPMGQEGAPHMVFSPLGVRVNAEVEHISRYYPQVRVIGKQVMPDHVHMLLYVTRPLPEGLGRVINGFKAGCRRAWREVLGTSPQSSEGRNTPTGTPPQSSEGRNTQGRAAPENTPGSVGAPVALRQGLPIHAHDSHHGTLWEPGYHDRILNGRGQLQHMVDYIHDNPRRLLVKRQHSPFFHLTSVVAAGRQLQALGNLQLLHAPVRIPVRCSRRMPQPDIARLCADLIAHGRQGAVLVSPFISPGERQVLRAAQSADVPVVHLLDNGLPDLYKPSGQAFDACAQGLLLLLSPWPYSTQRPTLTRDRCNQLNELTTNLCQ